MKTLLYIIKNIKSGELNHFNSVNHFVEIAKIYTGESPTKIRKRLNKLDYKFEDHVFKFDFTEEYLRPIRIPSYILITHSLKDKRYHLNVKDYEILDYLDLLKRKIHWGREEEKRLTRFGAVNWMEFLYPKIKTIAKATGYSYNEVRSSLHKLCFYFDKFYEKFSPLEEYNKKHWNIRTKSIHLPDRKLWKQIIEKKVLEETKLENIKITFPKLINNKNYEKWKKIAENEEELGKKPTSLVKFAEMLSKNLVQLELMRLAKEKWDSQKSEYAKASEKFTYKIFEWFPELFDDDDMLAPFLYNKFIENLKAFFRTCDLGTRQLQEASELSKEELEKFIVWEL